MSKEIDTLIQPRNAVLQKLAKQSENKTKQNKIQSNHSERPSGINEIDHNWPLE